MSTDSFNSICCSAVIMVVAQLATVTSYTFILFLLDWWTITQTPVCDTNLM